MNFKSFTICLSFAGMVFGIASCKPETEPVAEPLDLRVKVTDITPESAQITITPNHDKSTYYWTYRTIEEFDTFADEAAVKEADMATLKAKAETAGKSFEDYLASVLVSGPTSNGIEAKPQMQYCAYAYELDTKGVSSGHIFETRFTTPKEPCKVKLEILEQGMTYLEVNATSEDENICFYFDCMSDYLYEMYGGTDEGAARYFRESLEYTAENRGWTIEQVVEAIGCYGTKSRKIEGLELESDYYVYAVEIDNAGNVLNVTTTTTSTTERQISDMTIDINVATLNSFKSEIEFIPSNDEEPYYCQILTVQDYNKIVEEHGDYREYAIKTYGNHMSAFTYNGKHTATAKNLLAETEYIIFAFGFKDGVWVTDMFTKTIQTPAQNPSNDLKIKIEILETTNHYCNASFLPSDETVPYMFYYMSEDEYVEFGNDTLKSVQEYVTQYLAAYQEIYPQMTTAQLVNGLSKRANRTMLMKYLAPSTKFYAWAVAVDENGLIASEPALADFTTGDYTVAENCIVKGAKYRWYDGDSVAKHMIQFSSFKGIPGSIVDTVMVEGSNTWLGYFYKGDITDTEKYPDWYVTSNLYFTGKHNLSQGSIVFFRHTWNEEWTLCIAAKDENGNFGPAYREKVIFTKEGCSPIEECPLYDRFSAPEQTPAQDYIIPYRPGYSRTFTNLPKIDFSDVALIQPIRKQTAQHGAIFEAKQDKAMQSSDDNAAVLMKYPIKK